MKYIKDLKIYGLKLYHFCILFKLVHEENLNNRVFKKNFIFHNNFYNNRL